MLDERIEQLINRRLDGALTEDESLELDRELIRSPETRRAFEDSQRIDVLTCETLNALLDAGECRHYPASDGQVSPAARWITRRRLDGVIGVAAAVLLIMAGTSVLPQFGGGNSLTNRHGGGDRNLAGTGPTMTNSAGPVSAWPAEYTPVIDNTDVPRRQHQRIDQDVIAVVDPQTQTVYLLEIERSRNRTNRLRADY